MRIAILGATGLLGKALTQGRQGDEISGFGSREVDIRDAHQVAALLLRIRPDWTILAAAYTDVDGCEANRDLAFAVNCGGAIHVAEAAKQASSRLLFVSTDYVFDGNKTTPYEINDQPAPLNVYGQSKADAEVALRRILPDCCIVRTSWLFGTGGRCFPDTILKLAATRPQLDIVDDQRGSPTYVPDLARVIYQLCQAESAGLVHATNRGDCTWFDFAREIIVRAGLATIIRPATSEKVVRPARRPKYSVLSSRSLEQRSIFMPSWQDALYRYMEQKERI